MMLHLLDNIVWHALAGPHARFSAGTGTARRYAPGFSPIVGFADAARPDFAALAPHCEPGQHFYCGGWSGPAPAGWQIHTDATMDQMVWDAAEPATWHALDAVRLRPEHATQMLELVALTHPGPFGPRTPELGEYVGVFEGERLIAMAGERMEAGGLREISGVCTHPDFAGRGLARGLVEVLVRRQLARGQRPFLHVMQANERARALYARMGFAHHQPLAVRVVSRAA
jgi:ribosomal protein S18 acetylase RimI-like enzyme